MKRKVLGPFDESKSLDSQLIYIFISLKYYDFYKWLSKAWKFNPNKIQDKRFRLYTIGSCSKCKYFKVEENIDNFSLYCENKTREENFSICLDYNWFTLQSKLTCPLFEDNTR